MKTENPLFWIRFYDYKVCTESTRDYKFKHKFEFVLEKDKK